MGEKDTDILSNENNNHEKLVGHVNSNNEIRKKDGVFSKGDLMGYIDKENIIRKPDDTFSKGDAVGKIVGNEAYANDELFSKGELLGSVDDEGNIRTKDSVFEKGDKIGIVKGKNKQKALGFYVLKFDEIKEKVEELIKEVETANIKTFYIKKVNGMKNYVSKAKENTLGDFDKLFKMLEQAKILIDKELEENLSIKKSIISEAKAICDSFNWRETNEKFQELTKRWKSIGLVPYDKYNIIWEEFQSYKQKFYTRRKEWYKENLSKKMELINTIDNLTNQSQDWTIASRTVEDIRHDWKLIGDVPLDKNSEVNSKFTESLKRFYRVKNECYERYKQERKEKLRQYIKSSEEFRQSLEQSVADCESKIRYKRNKISQIWGGPKGDEIRKDCERSIDKNENQIAKIKNQIREVDFNISQMRNELTRLD